MIDTIFAAIKSKLELAQCSEKSAILDSRGTAKNRESEIRECEMCLRKLKLSQAALLESYLEGKLSKDAFQARKSQTAAAIEEAKDRLAALEARSETTSKFIENHKPFFNQESLTREMLQGLIKEIRITSADEMEIVWNFQDFYQETREFMS